MWGVVGLELKARPTNDSTSPTTYSKMSTQEKKQAFLDNYPKFIRASKTAEAIGINACTHYEWLKDDGAYNQRFQALKKEVDSDRLEEIENEIHDRSLDRDAYGSSTLLMFEAKALHPSRYREQVPTHPLIGDIKIVMAIPGYDESLRLKEANIIEGEVIKEGE